MRGQADCGLTAYVKYRVIRVYVSSWSSFRLRITMSSVRGGSCSSLLHSVVSLCLWMEGVRGSEVTSKFRFIFHLKNVLLLNVWYIHVSVVLQWLQCCTIVKRSSSIVYLHRNLNITISHVCSSEIAIGNRCVFARYIPSTSSSAVDGQNIRVQLKHAMYYPMYSVSSACEKYSPVHATTSAVA